MSFFNAAVELTKLGPIVTLADIPAELEQAKVHADQNNVEIPLVVELEARDFHRDVGVQKETFPTSFDCLTICPCRSRYFEHVWSFFVVGI